MIDEKTQVVVRSFDATRDAESLRECVIEQQDFHRRLEPSWPTGDAIVEDYLAYLDAECAAHNGCIIMAECRQQAAGFVCVVATTRNESPDDPAPFAQIHDVYVKREYRGQGVADMLIAEAERFARSHGARLMRLGVLNGNRRARNFYSRHGFREYAHVLTKSLE
jgi:ribosomal protein S18 acetylase RimI-like enzyme